MRAPSYVLLATFVASFHPTTVFASEAEDLFEQGRVALRENQIEVACDLLKRSQALDAAPGTLLNLADCEERRGNRVLAHGLFVQVGAVVDPLFSTEGKKRSLALEAQLSKITLRVNGLLPPRARLTLDGVAVAPDEARFVEPGPHMAVLSAPSLPVDDSERVAPIAGQALEVVFTIAAQKQPAASGGGGAGLPSLGIAGLVIGSLGVVSLGTAIGTGVAMLGVGECFPDDGEPDEPTCDRSPAAADEGRALETASTALFVVGGVLSATGIVLLAIAPWDEPESAGSASLQIGLDRVQLRLSF